MKAFDLSGQHIVVTGAGGGIGGEAAKLAASLGARVSVSDLHAPESLAEAIAQTGADARASAVDVTDRHAVEAWADELGPVDALIDCAAICPFDDWSEQGWDAMFDKVLDVNLHGPVNLVRAFMPGMRARRGGRIALVGSIAGRIGGVRSSPHYVMTKGGIHSFVRWAAKVGAADNVLVNAVAPGVVDTNMTVTQTFDTSEFPLGRKASALEIAGPLVFLVSPVAGYVSGAVLDVNGAMHFS